METLFIKGIACGLFYFAYVLSKFFLDSSNRKSFNIRQASAFLV